MSHTYGEAEAAYNLQLPECHLCSRLTRRLVPQVFPGAAEPGRARVVYDMRPSWEWTLLHAIILNIYGVSLIASAACGARGRGTLATRIQVSHAS